MLKDERSVVNRDGKFVFVLSQEQEYEAEARDNIIKSWEEQLKLNNEWLANLETIRVEQAKRLSEALDANKLKLIEENKNLEDGLNLWKNVK
jgi:hypothetical protein